MESWHETICTQEASAFAALGATVKIHGDLHERTSTRTVRFLISPETADAAWKTGKIRHACKLGTLPRTDPAHPYLTIRRAYHNREAILEIQRTGRRLRLAHVQGSTVYQYVPSDIGLPGLTAGTAAVRTGDIKTAAALVTVGFQLLRIEGADRAREYTLAAFPLPGAEPGIQAAPLLAEWHRDPEALPFELPFTQAMHGLAVREKLAAEVLKCIDMVLISKPGTTSHAAVRIDASPAAWDHAKTFLTSMRR